MSDMIVKLYELPDVHPYVARLMERGVVIRTPLLHERHQVVEWVRQTFGQRWADECDGAFYNRPVSCFITAEAGAITGFACYDCTHRDFFGPMGVAEGARGQGLGAALLLSCLHAMASLGYAYAIIGGVGPAEFYRQVAGAVTIAGSALRVERSRLNPPD